MNEPFFFVKTYLDYELYSIMSLLGFKAMPYTSKYADEYRRDVTALMDMKTHLTIKDTRYPLIVNAIRSLSMRSLYAQLGCPESLHAEKTQEYLTIMQEYKETLD